MAFSCQKHFAIMAIPVFILFCFVSVESFQPFTSFQLPNMPQTQQTETDKRLDELTVEIEELKKRIPSGGIQTQEAGATTNNNADMETMKTSIEQINAKLSQDTQKIDEVMRNAENLKNTVNQILPDVQQVKTKIEILEQSLQDDGSQYGKMTMKVEDIKQNLEQLETESVIAKSKVDLVENSVQQIEATMGEVDRSLNQVNNTIETVKTETARLEQSLQQVQTTANRASSEVGTMKQTLQQTETRLEEKQQELESSMDKVKNDMVHQEELGQKICIHGEQQNAITMDTIVTKIGQDEALDRLSFVDADGSPFGKPETLATDGRLDQTIKSCTHSKIGQANPWWEGDLGTVAEVHQVTLYNRVDCCGNRLVNFKLEGYETQTRQSPLLCKDVSDATGAITTIKCDNPIHARYIRITKYDDLVLTLCEVIAEGFHLPKKPQGHTVQISTASIDSGANLAYDGNPDTCSETADEAEGAWWQIKLSEMTTIVSVDVTNRKDDKYESLSDIEIVMYESQPSGCVDRPFTVCGSVVKTVEAGETVTVVCDPPVTGRYLRVNKKSGGPLSMCEIVMRKQDD